MMIHRASTCSPQCDFLFYFLMTKTDHTLTGYLALYVCETAKKVHTMKHS